MLRYECRQSLSYTVPGVFCPGPGYLTRSTEILSGPWYCAMIEAIISACPFPILHAQGVPVLPRCCAMSADRQPVSFSLLLKGCPVQYLDTGLYESRQPVCLPFSFEHFWCSGLYLNVLFLLNISVVLPCTWKLSYECRQPVSSSFSCWTYRRYRLSCLVPRNWAMSADTLSACPFPVEHFGCPVFYLEIELWVQTPCQLVLFLLNISGVLSCT